MTHPSSNTDATVIDDRLDGKERNGPVACETDSRKIPVAYEEVTLTEEAAEILEKERMAATKRPARKIRHVAVEENATP